MIDLVDVHGVKVNPSIPRPLEWDIPFDTSIQLDSRRGLSLPAPTSVGTGAGRQGLSGAF
jgi:hypothetical protein